MNEPSDALNARHHSLGEHGSRYPMPRPRQALTDEAGILTSSPDVGNARPRYDPFRIPRRDARRWCNYQGVTVLPIAIFTITAALIFYTIAVFWEKRTGILRGRHLLMFWLGLICDTTGTTLMGRIAGDVFKLSFHGITGGLAILLMLMHAIWAMVVHASKRPAPKAQFHKYSIFVWAIWLVPYVSGLAYGMFFRG